MKAQAIKNICVIGAGNMGIRFPCCAPWPLPQDLHGSSEAQLQKRGNSCRIIYPGGWLR